MYALGALPTAYSRLTAALRPVSVAPLPTALPTVTTARAPLMPSLVAAAAARALTPPAPTSPLISRLVEQAKIVAPVPVTAPRSIAPTAPTATPSLRPPIARIMEAARESRLSAEAAQRAAAAERAAALVASRPPGSTVPVPVPPFEAQALLPAPPPTGAPPSTSPFSLVPAETVPSVPTPPTDEVIDEAAAAPATKPGLPPWILPAAMVGLTIVSRGGLGEGAGELELTEALPIARILPRFAPFPDWLEDTFPGVPAATEGSEYRAVTDPQDVLAFYGELGQGDSERELDTLRTELRPGSQVVPGQVNAGQVILGILGLLVLGRLLKGAGRPTGRRYTGGKASWQ